MKHVKLSTLVVLLLLLGSVAAHAASAKGKVTVNGDPAARALVIYLLNGAEKARTSTGDDGRFYVSGLAEGSYTVKVKYRSQEKTFNVTVRASDNSHTLVL